MIEASDPARQNPDEPAPGAETGPGAEAGPGAGDSAPEPTSHHHRADAIASNVLGGAMTHAVRAGVSGEALTSESVLSAIGGWRGVVETILPGLLFLGIFIPTQDARISALVPGALAVALVVIRLIRREPLVSALSGMLGVGVAVLITLVTGRGVDYYLSGFVINTVWAIGLLVSILVGWPALGFVLGLFKGNTTGWRRDPHLKRTSTFLTLLWLAMFIARLIVQIPLYLADRVEALGVARLAMGTPLFALVIIATWLVARRRTASSDDSSDDSVENTGQNTPSV